MKKLLIKIGGSLLDEEDNFQSICKQVSEISKNYQVVFVHGGGKELTQWQEKLNIPVKFIDGNRYTGKDTAELAEMVIGGKVQNKIISCLTALGVKAIGLTGKDAKLFETDKVKSEPEIGYVGEILKVNSELIDDLWRYEYTPVISCTGGDFEQTLNINADIVAAEIAKAMQVDKLIFLSNIDGLKIDGELVKRMSATQCRQILKHPDVSTGMIPKLKACLSAVTNGVPSVMMLNGSVENIIIQALNFSELSCTVIEAD